MRGDPSRQFAFLLALTFGEVNPEDVLSRMTRRRFLEWMAYYRVQPWGDIRSDYRMAKIVKAFVGGDLMDHMDFLEREEADPSLLAEQMGM